MPKTPVKKKKLAQALVLSRKGAPKKAKHRKSSKEEMYERRQLVLRMRLRGKTYRQIAKELGVATMTVKRDLQLIKDQQASRVTQFERDKALGECLQTYELIHQEAWEQYHSAVVGSDNRVKFLNLIRAAENDRVKVLMDVGMIGRDAVRIEHEHSHKADAVLAGLTKDAQQLIAMALLKAQLKPPGEPILELPETTGGSTVIEATVEPKESKHEDQ